jgi:hypothetical protein
VLRVGAYAAKPPLTLANWGPGGRLTIICQSQHDRYAYCRTYTNGRVRLLQQLSRSPCRQYDTWGEDGDGSGIWVRNGCRAVFAVEGYGWGGGGRGEGGIIICQSEHYHYNHCPVNWRGRRVRLGRQLSDASCIQGSSWGVDRYGIWVDNGCAAEFIVR